MSSAAEKTIQLTFNGKQQSFPLGVTAADVFGKTKGTVGALLNGKLTDLVSPIREDGELVALSRTDEPALELLRHSTAHLMAEAVQALFPGTKVTIGPVIEDGFYYDFDPDEPFTEKDLVEIEKKMRSLAKRNEALSRSEVSKKEAIKIFNGLGESYKEEIINDLGGDIFSIYHQGEWFDLCRGPHVPRTGEIKHFKLLKVAGAYWRGDEKNKMLCRVYGTAFFTAEDLKDHLDRLAEAEKRDHRKLGKELDLFSISPEIGAGMILWHPKGARARSLIEDFWRQAHYDHGYEMVFSPHVAHASLWDTSGHTGFYSDNMYPSMDIEDQPYFVKPMNCPFHMQIYKSQLRSYRDLPLRWAELGTVYRYERSGVLHGLMRVRGFTQDDAHLFMTEEQMLDETVEVLKFAQFMLRRFGFEDFDVYLSTRPEKFVGTEENWEVATETLKQALEKTGVAYQIDPGEGVFYGPKIDIKIRDSLKRSWQCSTIQVDFNLPERFGLEYVDASGQRKRPIMLHRALLGSIERFFGVLLEHYAGAFPFWLAPEQIRILPITDDQMGYAEEVCKPLLDQGFRVTIDKRNEKLGYKIRSAQTEKIPVMLILGKQEVEDNTVSIRHRDGTEEKGHNLKSLFNILKEKNETTSKLS